MTAGLVATGRPVSSIDPRDAGPLTTTPRSTPEDVSTAFARARAAQKDWAARPVADRAKIFLTLYDLLIDRQAVGMDLVQTETGKARLHAFEEIIDGATSTLFYARQAPKLLRESKRAGALPLLTRTIQRAEPRGVVTLITPWNYPLALTMDAVPALLAGNAVVHKPDTQTALSSLWPRMLAVEAGLPADLWPVVLGDPADIGDQLVDETDYVAFTGSTAAGRIIGQRAAGRLIGASLELGGKNPMLVLADADLDIAVRAGVRACFANAGQLCVSMERIYVDAAIHDEFVRMFARRVAKLKLGTALDFSADVGSLTSQRQLDRVSGQVDAARSAGATVVTGGRPRPDIGPYVYEPTILTDVPAGCVVDSEETFGPVVSVAPFRTEEEAVRRANDSPYGLNAAIFSRDVRRARALAARIRAGTVNINEGYAAAYASQGASMGGMKQSGLGRRHGPEGMLRFTESQSVASQHVIGFDPAFGLGQRGFARALTLMMRALKGVRYR